MSDRSLLNVFVATGGHAFARDALEAMLRDVGAQPCFVDHPAAARLMNPEGLRGFDAILLHDMPGMDFRSPITTRPEPLAPPPELITGMAALVEQGMGFVALHHALAGWPAWPAYAELLGGAFLYRPQDVRGAMREGSAYCPEGSYDVFRAETPHPVLAGVPEQFKLVDEPYHHEIFGADIEPLLWRGPVEGSFLSATHAVRRQPDPGGAVDVQERPIIGWAMSAGNSPVVSLQPGDNADTFANPAYRTIVGNSLHWVASPKGRLWASGRGRPNHFKSPMNHQSHKGIGHAKASQAGELR